MTRQAIVISNGIDSNTEEGFVRLCRIAVSRSNMHTPIWPAIQFAKVKAGFIAEAGPNLMATNHHAWIKS